MTPVSDAARKNVAPSHMSSVYTLDTAQVIVGKVVAGDRRGRELGFPTANLALEPNAPVEHGVWAAFVHIDDRRHIAAVSVGHRPTYYSDQGVPLLEAHLLDFHGDLYGATIVVDLRYRLRPQRRFASSIALIRQMRRDIDSVRRWGQSAERQSPYPNQHPSSRAKPDQGLSRMRLSRREQRDRRIAAAAQYAIVQDEFCHERVAELAEVPLGFVRWTYPTESDLRSAAGTVEVLHPF